jgi:phospholipase C
MRRVSRLLLVAAILLLIGIWRIAPFKLFHQAQAHTMGIPSTPITHAVFIMLENHTFDNFFGSYTCPSGDSNCDTVNGYTLPQQTNPFESDYNHGSAAAYAGLDSGKMDGFEQHGYYQYKQSDIPIYWYYAQHYGLGDNFFTSYASSSTPNHLAMFAAQTGGIFETTTQNGCASQANDIVHSVSITNASFHYWAAPCVNIPTLAPTLATAGLSWKYYCDVPIWCAPKMIQSVDTAPNNVHVGTFATDIAHSKSSCALANVSWVTPTGIWTDHPPSLLEPAQNVMNDDIQAIMHSPCWNSTAIFLTWDDWGGQFDHVVPPQISSAGPGLGMRVPLVVISPYSKPGYVSHQVAEFSSFPKFVESNWSLPNLGARDALSSTSDLMDYFDFSQPPQQPPTDLPSDFPNTNLDMLHVPSQGLGLGASGTLNPIIGGTSTKYTFSVIYTPAVSGLTPSVADISIDGGAGIPMTPGGTSSGGGGIPGGTIYNYTTTLPVGLHQYYFTFTDSTGTKTLPHNGVPFIGPEVHPFLLNALTSPVKPSPALPEQNVTFTVTYSSPAGLPPTRAEVDIDGVPHPMTLKDAHPNYVKGAHYIYTTNSLSRGIHYTIYRFDDGSGVAAYPGRITPLVTPVILSKPSGSGCFSVCPTSGGSSTTFTFQTIYSNVNGDPPTSATLYIDNVAFPTQMSCDSNCNYKQGAIFHLQTTLAAGKHTFFFVFTDSNSAVKSTWADPIGPQTYAGPNVGANAKAVQPGTLVGEPGDTD